MNSLDAGYPIAEILSISREAKRLMRIKFATSRFPVYGSWLASGII
jgi:hypothetical protein